MKKKWLRRGLAAVLGVVFLVSVFMLGLQTWQNRLSDEADAEAAELVKLPELPAVSLSPKAFPTGGETPGTEESQTPVEPVELEPVGEDPYAQALREMDFTALQEVNPDVVGWLVIPGTGISYPLLQGATNQTYLRHTWRGEYSTRGSHHRIRPPDAKRHHVRAVGQLWQRELPAGPPLRVYRHQQRHLPL